MTDARSDFRPTASWENLRRRAELLRQVRFFFDQRGFLEVETPLLSRGHAWSIGISIRCRSR